MRFELLGTLAAVVILSGSIGFARADDAAAPAPSTQPATTQPAGATIAPEAREVLNHLDAAYGKLKTLELSGTFTGEIEAGGQKLNQSAAFKAFFEAPAKFRHEMENDILCGSTGEKAYSYLKSRNVYTFVDAPKEKVATVDLARPIPTVLSMQDISLLLAVVKEPARELTDDATNVVKLEDTKIGDSACPTIQLTLKDGAVRTLALDPATSLVRRCTSDARAILKAQGAPDVKLATLTVDYTASRPDAQLNAAQFVWTPPDGAKDFAKVASADEPGEAAAKLEGKAAPDFKLKGMDDKVVTLAELKGQVVVLDFWATWCGPCRASLPHLQKLYELYESKKEQGVQIFAVNQQEDKAKVQKFIEETKLTVSVLLDTEGEIGQKYSVEGIPQTVVIGKDGKVKKVFIGFGDGMPEELAKAVSAAQK